MKNPFKKEQTPQNPLSQERKPSTPPAVQYLADADLEQVQGGVSLNYSTIQWTYTKQDDTGATKPK